MLIAERHENQRGVFYKFLQVRNGEVCNIYVLGGQSLQVWKKMEECLDNLVGRRARKGEMMETMETCPRNLDQ